MNRNITFITHYAGLYGANRSLLNLVDGLKKYNLQFSLIAPSGGEIVDEFNKRSIPVAIFPIEFWISLNPKPGFTMLHLAAFVKNYYLWKRAAFKRIKINMRLLPKIVKQLNLWNTNLIYTNSSVTPIGMMAAKIMRCPHIWHLREFIDLDYGFTYDWGKKFTRFIIRNVGKQIAVSEAIKTYFLNGTRSSKKMSVVYNGVTTRALFDSLYEKSLNHHSISTKANFTFAMVAFIHPYKGHEEAVRALALVNLKYPAIRLIIAGEGDISNLKKVSLDLGVADKIDFWGYVNDPYKVYQVSDVLLMCSRNEGMGRVTVEAMSACLPVIGYDNAGTAEIIQHDTTGLLYKNGHQDLAKCMIHLIEAPVLAKQIGFNAWKMARGKFTIESYAAQVYAVLQSV